MREILFRGKRKYNGKWVEGNYHKVYNKSETFHDILDYGICPAAYIVDP